VHIKQHHNVHITGHRITLHATTKQRYNRQTLDDIIDKYKTEQSPR